jgi:hypothetical protein
MFQKGDLVKLSYPSHPLGFSNVLIGIYLETRNPDKGNEEHIVWATGQKYSLNKEQALSWLEKVNVPKR